MKFWDILKISNRNLFRNKLRTLLTVAAIFVGSFTLTMTNAIGDGVRSYIDKSIETVEGDAVLNVQRSFGPEPTDSIGVGATEIPDKDSASPNIYQDVASKNLTLEQMQAALRPLPEVKSVTPDYVFYSEYLTIDDGTKHRSATEMLAPGYTAKVEHGSSINGPGQLIIASQIAESMAGDKAKVADLIGRSATLGYKDKNQNTQTLPLRIVGVSTRGFMMDFPISYVDPQTAGIIHTAQKQGDNNDTFYAFSVELTTSDQASKDKVKKIVKENGYKAESPAEERKEIYNAINIFKLAMSLIALIALLAASFGIINTLVIAVLERTKEIGLQKALGMGRGKIFAIFSMESVLIGLWGAFFGIAGAMIVGFSANQLLYSIYGDDLAGYRLFVFTASSIFITISLVCTIAFLAGVLPAFRASRLNPIESLRHE